MSATVKYGKKRDRESTSVPQLCDENRGLVERLDSENLSNAATLRFDEFSIKRSSATLASYGVFVRGKKVTTNENSNSSNVKESTQPSFQQTYLELGQSKFDSVQCKLCGMVYTPGFKKESRQHDAFCKESTNAFTHLWFSPVKDENVVWSSITSTKRDLKCAVPGYIVRIVGIPSSSSPLDAQFHKVQKLLSTNLGDESSPFSTRNNASHSSLESVITWVYLEHDREKRTSVIAGILTTEPISSAYSPSVAPSSWSKSVIGVMSIDSTSTPVENLVLGIAQVYTNPKYQRKGVASALLDVARASAVYGYAVPKEKIAFSQLTEKGSMFAASYLRPSKLLIYR
jgi:GNAT superfamily N-acetyltransferase